MGVETVPELEITIIPCLKDNYAYLLRSGALCAVIDPAEKENPSSHKPVWT